MRPRDRILSAVVVGGVIAAIWIAGAKFRGGDEASDGAAEAASGKPIASALTSASASESPIAAPDASALSADAAPPMSGACRAILDASTKKLADAKVARACTPDFDLGALACRTSANGATWGLRVDDVVDLGDAPTACGTGFLVRLVHLDVNGAESVVVPGISATMRAHTYDVGPDLRIDATATAFFDWDGDGEDEVFVRGTRGASDRPDEERAIVWTFHGTDGAAHLAPYAPASSFTLLAVRDIDADGRPDLVVSFFGTGAASPDTTRRFAAHALADGTFTLHDAAAVAWAEKQCPTDAPLDLESKTAADFDASLADALVCALVWGHDPKTLATQITKACTATPDASTCPAWSTRITRARPPLSLR